MQIEDYKRFYEELNARLGVLTEQRVEMEAALGDLVKEIESLGETIIHLAPLAGYIFNPENIANLGITEAVRTVLDPAKRLSVSEIKVKMQERGFDFSTYSAPNASIHTILKRLVEAGKAAVEKEGWKTYYKYQLTDEEIPF